MNIYKELMDLKQGAFHVGNRWRVEPLVDARDNQPSTPPPSLADLATFYDMGARSSRHFFRAASKSHIAALKKCTHKERLECCIDYFERWNIANDNRANWSFIFPTAWWTDGTTFIYCAERKTGFREWLNEAMRRMPTKTINVFLLGQEEVKCRELLACVTEKTVAGVPGWCAVKCIKPLDGELWVFVD